MIGEAQNDQTEVKNPRMLGIIIFLQMACLSSAWLWFLDHCIMFLLPVVAHPAYQRRGCCETLLEVSMLLAACLIWGPVAPSPTLKIQLSKSRVLKGTWVGF